MVASSTTIAAMCQGQGPRGKLREDGRMVHDMYLVEVKTPAESSGPWDYYKIIATIPGDQAFRPAGEDGCPLIKR
jgi:branched-chain amino acid transport system substrate-binding protein